MGNPRKLSPLWRTLIAAALTISATGAGLASSTSLSAKGPIEPKLRETPLLFAPERPSLLDIALQAAATGDRFKLTRIYRLGLLTEQKQSAKHSANALLFALAQAHAAAKQSYCQGDINEAIERLRLIFNLTTILSEAEQLPQINEPDIWIRSWHNLSLPSESWVGPLNDYALFLNCSGQYAEAISVLRAIIAERPDRTIAYLNLADALSAQGKQAEAVKQYKHYRMLANCAHSNVVAKQSDRAASSAAPIPSHLTEAGQSYEGEDHTCPPDIIAILSTNCSVIDPDKVHDTKCGITATVAPKENNPALGLPILTLTNCWFEKPNDRGYHPIEEEALTDRVAAAMIPNKRTAYKHEVLETERQQSQDLNDWAILALQDHDPQDAVKTLNEAMSLDPGCLMTIYNLAVAYNSLALQESKRPFEALHLLHQAQALVPWHKSLQANSEAIIAKTGENPKSFPVRLQLARQLFDQRDYLGASVEYRQALNIRDDPAARVSLYALTEQLISEELLSQPLKVSDLKL